MGGEEIAEALSSSVPELRVFQDLEKETKEMRIDIEQGTDEWLDWRKGEGDIHGIGGSDVSKILGVSRYGSALDLYNEKLDLTPPNDESGKEFILARGHRIEKVARKRVEMIMGEPYPPTCWQHDDLPFVRVSLDGLSMSEISLLECKYVGSDVLASVNAGHIAPDHRWQCIYGCLATGAKTAIYIAVDPNDDTAMWTFQPSAAELDFVRNAVIEFHERLVKRDPPKEESESDFRGNNEVCALVSEVLDVQDQIAALAARKDALMKNLEEAVGSVDEAETPEGTFKRSFRRGSIDYKKVVQDAGINFDESKYRRNPSTPITVKRNT